MVRPLIVRGSVEQCQIHLVEEQRQFKTPGDILLESTRAQGEEGQCPAQTPGEEGQRPAQTPKQIAASSRGVASGRDVALGRDVASGHEVAAQSIADCMTSSLFTVYVTAARISCYCKSGMESDVLHIERRSVRRQSTNQDRKLDEGIGRLAPSGWCPNGHSWHACDVANESNPPH